MVDPEHPGAQSRTLRNQAPGFRREVSRAGVTESPVGLETFEVGGAHSTGNSVQFRVVPGNRECDGRIQQRAEVVCIMRVLPEIVGIDQYESSNGLLKARVELIAKAGLDRDRGRSEHVL